jgi:hypothetical protein
MKVWHISSLICARCLFGRPEAIVIHRTMTDSSRISSIAQAERAAVTEFAERLLPPDTRVSVYLYQPVAAPGLREESPGTLWDIGPVPPGASSVARELLYTCAESGRTGSFLQSGDECTRRVPQTTRINAAAADSYRSYNRDNAVRRAQIAVEAARHGFEAKNPDGPPEGFHIHHLALAPGAQSFDAVASGRIPVLGTIFALTKERDPHDRHEYANLVDYAIFIAGEVLEIRAEHLFGRAHLAAGFEGSALEALLDSPTSDAAVQLAVKLLFAHHWFFPYDPTAWSLLARSLGGPDNSRATYERHEWTPPRRHANGGDTRTDDELRATVVGDLTTLVQHIAWYRLGTEFRPRPGAVRESVALSVNTALLLLCGERTSLPAFRVGSRPTRRRDEAVYLGPPRALSGIGRAGDVVAPVFPLSGLQQLVRGSVSEARNGVNLVDRFAASLGVCGPGDTGGLTRTHLKPSSFVDGFEHGGAPRVSVRLRDGMRERTRWLCSYAIGRLAASVAAEREQPSDAESPRSRA